MFRFYPPENDAGGGYPHPVNCPCPQRHPQMIVTPEEEPLLCAVCGCRWIEFASPEDECAEATCPCHNKYWDATDELVKRYLWGDR